MKKTASKKIKNSTLVALFFLLVIFLIIISIIIKVISLVLHSVVDSRHQFILDISRSDNTQQIVAFNRSANTIHLLQVKNVKNFQDIQNLQIPIDAYITLDDPKQHGLPSELFSIIFHCGYPTCKNLNAVDALKLYLFVTNIRPISLQTSIVSIPVSQIDLKTTIPEIFTDDILYHEALSISVINASGEVGLGNEASQFLSNIGGNVVSITSAETQGETTLQSTYGKDSYTIQRLEKVLHLTAQKMQKPGISDIIITIGKHHPAL